MEYSIECAGLEKTYPGFRLGPLDLRVEQGTVVGLVGPNGAGKTTLIKLLLGLASADNGAIALFGRMLHDPAIMPDELKSRIGVVLDTCAFPQASKVADVARLGRAVYRKWDQDRFSSLLDDFGLQPSKQVSKLSRGMGMKLSIAFAMSHHPDLLILDEATAGLDPIAREEVLETLRQFMLDEHHSILMSTHITSDLEKIADMVVCIDAGKIVFKESKDSICDETGIAHLRESQLEDLLSDSEALSAILRIQRHDYGIDALVADRFAFGSLHPDIPMDNATIDDYMNMFLKGGIPC